MAVDHLTYAEHGNRNVLLMNERANNMDDLVLNDLYSKNTRLSIARIIANIFLIVLFFVSSYHWLTNNKSPFRWIILGCIILFTILNIILSKIIDKDRDAIAARIIQLVYKDRFVVNNVGYIRKPSGKRYLTDAKEELLFGRVEEYDKQEEDEETEDEDNLVPKDVANNKIKRMKQQQKKSETVRETETESAIIPYFKIDGSYDSISFSYIEYKRLKEKSRRLPFGIEYKSKRWSKPKIYCKYKLLDDFNGKVDLLIKGNVPLLERRSNIETEDMLFNNTFVIKSSDSRGAIRLLSPTHIIRIMDVYNKSMNRKKIKSLLHMVFMNGYLTITDDVDYETKIQVGLLRITDYTKTRSKCIGSMKQIEDYTSDLKLTTDQYTMEV